MKVSKCSRGINRKVRRSDQQNRWCQSNTVFQGFSEDLSEKPGMIFDGPPITDPASLFQPDEGVFGQAPAFGHACQELIASRHTGPTLFLNLAKEPVGDDDGMVPQERGKAPGRSVCLNAEADDEHAPGACHDEDRGAHGSPGSYETIFITSNPFFSGARSQRSRKTRTYRSGLPGTARTTSPAVSPYPNRSLSAMPGVNPWHGRKGEHIPCRKSTPSAGAGGPGTNRSATGPISETTLMVPRPPAVFPTWRGRNGWKGRISG